MLPAKPLGIDVHTAAKERLRHIFDTFDHVAVAFSGGKDSTAVLNVALEVLHEDEERWAKHLPLRAIHFDEEAIPYETEEYVRRVSQRPDVALEWMCLPVQHLNACSRRHPYWYPWAPEDREKWCRPLPPEAITELAGFPVEPPEARLQHNDTNGLFFPPSMGNCCLMLGIRTQESLTRRRAVTNKRGDNYIIKSTDLTAQGNLYKAYPIYDWTTEDVWTAPKTLGWDYNRAYDRMEMAGIKHHAQRCSPAFGAEPILGLWCFATCFPEVWDPMTERVPGVGAAVRYARTELYAYKDRPDRPADASWPEFLSYFLTKFDRKANAKLRKRVATFIEQHYNKSPHPIMADAPHPVTGVCWDFLLTLAMRGDHKERKNVRLYHLDDDDEMTKAWTRYAKELRDVLASGEFAKYGHPGRQPRSALDVVPEKYRQSVQIALGDDECANVQSA